MAANPPTTFRGYLASTPDPNADDMGALDRAFATGDPALTSAVCFGNCEHPVHLHIFVANPTATHRPLMFCAPFNTDAPGRADNTGQKYVLSGDISDTGTMPPVVVIDDTTFDETPAATVPTMATFLAAWTALAPGNDRLPIPGANTEQIATRQMMVVPYPYAGIMLQAQMDGNLTWRWIVANVVTPILGDAAQVQAYTHFLNYVRVASTALPPDGAGDPQYPVTEMYFAAIFDMPRVQQMLEPMVRRYLAGYGQPTGLNAHMANLIQQQAVLTQNVATMQQRPAKTLGESQPILCAMAMKMSEVPTEAQLPEFWHTFNLVPRGGALGALELAFQQVGGDLNLSHPVITASFATDFAAGRWIAGHASAVTQGLSIMRLNTTLSNPQTIQTQQANNRAFNILHQVTGATGQAITMALTDTAADLPRDTTELRALLQAFHVMGVSLFGPTCSLNRAYKRDVIDQLLNIEAKIRTDYYDSQRHVCLIILVHVFRTFNHAASNLINGPMPTALNPAPSVQNPNYIDIAQALLSGRIMFLTDLPPALAQVQFSQLPRGPPALPGPPVLPPAGPPAGPPVQPPPVQPAPVPGGGQRTRVENLNQNPELKAAWTALGVDSIFGATGPYRDAGAPGNKRVIMRLAGNQNQRICLPMALRGICYSNCGGYHGALTPNEVQAVAAAGGYRVGA